MKLAAMLAVATRALRAHRLLLVVLYLVQLVTSLAFALIVARWLSDTYAHRPLFAQGVAGDDTALILALLPELSALRALAWAGAGLLVLYALLSIYLGAGLLGAFAGLGFTATARARALAFGRLWLWSLIPYAAGGLVLVAGVRSYGPVRADLIDLGFMAGRLLLSAAPGALIILVTACAVDHGRAELVLWGGGAARALARGFAVVLGRRVALAWYALYLTAWLAVTAGYVALTAGRPFAGAAGAVTLFVLRQVVAATRFAARCATSAGQVALQREDLDARRPTAPEPMG
jgi:hypothetical protein